MQRVGRKGLGMRLPRKAGGGGGGENEATQEVVGGENEATQDGRG